MNRQTFGRFISKKQTFLKTKVDISCIMCYFKCEQNLWTNSIWNYTITTLWVNQWLRVSNQYDPRLNPVGSQFSIPVLLNLCSKSAGANIFEILVEYYDNGGLSSITVRMEYLFPFQFWYYELIVKTNEGEADSIVLLIFVLWRYFNRRWVSSCGVGQEVVFKASWNRIFF